jgi:hypothetical protein
MLAVRRAIVAGLLAEAEPRRNAPAARDLRTGLTGYQRVEPLAELALRLVREQLEQPFGDGQAQTRSPRNSSRS